MGRVWTSPSTRTGAKLWMLHWAPSTQISVEDVEKQDIVTEQIVQRETQKK